MRHLPLRLLIAPLVLAAGVVGSGCDETTDTRPDEERIVGVWSAESFNATTALGVPIPVLDLESGGDESSFTFESDRDFSFRLDPADGRTISIPQTSIQIPLTVTVSFSGTYELHADDNEMHLTRDGIPGEITLGYELSGDDELELLIEDPETLALLVGLATDDATFEALATVVTGGSISLRN